MLKLKNCWLTVRKQKLLPHFKRQIPIVMRQTAGNQFIMFKRKSILLLVNGSKLPKPLKMLAITKTLLSVF